MNGRQPGVLILFPGLGIGAGGGGEKLTLRLARGLVASGYRVTVVVGQPRRSLPAWDPVTVDGHQIPVLWLPRPPVWLLGSMFYAILVGVYLLTDLSGMPVVHITSVDRPAALMTVIARIAGRRVFCRSMGGGVRRLARQEREGHPVVRAHILALQCAHTIIVQNREQASILGDLGIERAKITVIPNGVDVSHYRPYQGDKRTLRSRLGLPEQSKVVCWVGMLRPIKRVDVVLEAFSLLAAEYPGCRLLVVGDGEQWDTLHELADFLGVREKVRFEGRVEDSLEYLQASDVFVLASDMETHPNALIEAMSCGLPIVATAVSGNKNCIQHGVNGLLVPREAPAEMAQAILEICKDEALAARLGANARRAALEHYTVERMVDQYLHLYCLPQMDPLL